MQCYIITVSMHIMHVYSVVLYMCFLLHTVYQCALYCVYGVRSTGEFPCTSCMCIQLCFTCVSYYIQFTSVHCVVMHVYSVVLYMCFLLHTVYQCALCCDGVRSTSEFPNLVPVLYVNFLYLTVGWIGFG